MNFSKIRRSLSCKLIFLLTMLLCLLNLSTMVSETFSHNSGVYSGMLEIDFKDAVYGDETGEIFQKDIKELKNGSFWDEMSYLSEMDAPAEANGMGSPVKLALTDSSYSGFSSLKMLKGAFISENACINGRNVAVISSRLAYKLFSTLDVLGNEIQIFGERYSIIGVYEAERFAASFFGADGMEKVYVPFSSYKEPRKLPVNKIFIRDTGSEEDGFAEDSIRDILVQKLNIDVSSFRIYNFYLSPVLIYQIEGVFIFLAGVCCLWKLLMLMKIYLRRLVEELHTSLKDNYLYRAVKMKKFTLMKTAAVILALLGGAAGIVLLIRFRFYVPSRYIPQENIFDFGFYGDKIKEAVIASNQISEFARSEINSYFVNALKLNTIIILCALIAFLAAGSAVKFMKLAGHAIYDVTRSMMTAIPVAYIFSFLLSYAFDMDFSLSVKGGIVVLVSFVLLAGDTVEHGDTV